MKCYGAPGEAPCATPATLRCVPLPVAVAPIMEFCNRHFWTWNAASLRRRDILEAAAPIEAAVARGDLDAKPQPVRVTAIPFHMVAPDVGFEEDSSFDEEDEEAEERRASDEEE